MKKLSEKQLKSNDHIPTGEIEEDIRITQSEVDDFRDEKDILMRRPQENRVKIYMLEGKISQREEFINKLEQKLEYRKNDR